MSSQFYTEDVPETLLRCLGDVEWSSFADLGCGEGVILNALDQMGLFSGKSVYAVDQSEERLSRVKQINNDFTCLAADASQTTIESNSIDLVISTQVIEHVPDDEAMVKEIQRILIPGGTAFVDTIFKKWYGWYFYRCNGKWTMALPTLGNTPKINSYWTSSPKTAWGSKPPKRTFAKSL